MPTLANLGNPVVILYNWLVSSHSYCIVSICHVSLPITLHFFFWNSFVQSRSSTPFTRWKCATLHFLHNLNVSYLLRDKCFLFQPFVHVGQYSEGEFALPSVMVRIPDNMTTMQEIPDDIFDSFDNASELVVLFWFFKGVSCLFYRECVAVFTWYSPWYFLSNFTFFPFINASQITFLPLYSVIA